MRKSKTKRKRLEKELKSDQNGIEILASNLALAFRFVLKSDQNGIEIKLEQLIESRMRG